jgi:sarcosine oxidase subunit beta
LTDGSVYVSVGVVESGHLLDGTTADAVVVGGGTVGAWCAYFLKRSGLGRVVLLEVSTLGQGASSRAAGIVRSQGGTPTAVRLAEWSKRFYRSQQDELGIDSGFVRQGYYLPCFTDEDIRAARQRLDMQRSLGQLVRWVEPDEAEALNPTLAKGSTRGGTFLDDDGYLQPPRNVLAYTVALATSGVEVHERVPFTGLVTAGDRLVGVETGHGTISSGTVVLTGGPQLASVGVLAGTRIPAGGVRHQVAVTEPSPELDPGRLPMVFDLSAGLYWRPEEGGLLFGMSNPDEPPGEATEIDWAYLGAMRQRLAQLVPATRSLGLRRVWAATIDYTPDHLPILGPVLGRDGPLAGTVVASAGGHGMMWGPGVSRAAADLALRGSTEVVDATVLGLDRFDEYGHSRLDPDPIALPFPERTTTP